MPPRLLSLTGHWSACDLPILPFLAPRVFQPWPSNHPRHTETRRSQHGLADVGENQDNELPPSEFRRGGRDREIFTRNENHVSHRGQHKNAGTHRPQVTKTSEDPLPHDRTVNKDTVCGLALEEHCLVESHGTLGLTRTIPKQNSSHVDDVGVSSQGIYEKAFRRQLDQVCSGAEASVVEHGPKQVSMYLGPSVHRDKSLRFGGSVSRRLPTYEKRTRPQCQQSRDSSDLSAPRGRFTLSGTAYSINLAGVRRAGIEPANDIRGQNGTVPTPSPSPSPLGEIAAFWFTSLAILKVRHRRTPMRAIQYPSSPTVTNARKQFESCLREATVAADPEDYVRKMWAQVPTSTKSALWPVLLVQALDQSPYMAITVLKATYIDPYPPTRLIEQYLRCLYAGYFRCCECYERSVGYISDQVCHLLSSAPKGVLRFSQHTIYCLLHKSSKRSVKKLYLALRDANQPLHGHTLMQFASVLASHDVDLAFGIMQQMKSIGWDFTRRKMQPIASKILIHAHRTTSLSLSIADILDFMVQSGLVPDTAMYNVLLTKSLQNGDHMSAWGIYDMLEDGMGPDKYTYSMLLNDAKTRMDSSAVSKVTGLIQQKGVVSPHIITDVLHAIMLFHQNQADTVQCDESLAQNWKGSLFSAFDRMLQVYCGHFRVAPLARLIYALPGVHYPEQHKILLEDVSARQAQLQEPHATTLNVMIAGFLCTELRDHVAAQLFSRLRALMEVGGPDVAHLAESTHIWDLCISACGVKSKRYRDPDKVAVCSTILEYMLLTEQHDDVITSGPRIERGKRPIRPPRPGLRTWSIMLNIFMQQGQPRAAEKVLSMMMERNIKPTIVTWNTLINGYASSQNTTMVADAISRMEESGIKPNIITMRILEKITARLELRRVLDIKKLEKLAA